MIDARIKITFECAGGCGATETTSKLGIHEATKPPEGWFMFAAWVVDIMNSRSLTMNSDREKTICPRYASVCPKCWPGFITEQIASQDIVDGWELRVEVRKGFL